MGREIQYIKMHDTKNITVNNKHMHNKSSLLY